MVENNKNKLRQRQRQQKAGTLMTLFLLVVGIILLLDVSKLKLNSMYSYNDDSSSYNFVLSLSSTSAATTGNFSFHDDEQTGENNSIATTTEHSQHHHHHHHYKNETYDEEEEGISSTKAVYEDSRTVTNGIHSFNKSSNNTRKSIFQQRIDDYFSSLKQQQQQQLQQTDLYYHNISWIQNYLVWHDSMRMTYPESTIFNFDNNNNNNNNNATTTLSTTERNKKKELPKIAIAYMDPQKNQGGLTDRLKGLGHLLWKCYKENRVLFLKWFDAPLQLEEFLLPNLINWTLPQDHINLQSAEKLRIISFDGSDGSNNDNDDDGSAKQRSNDNVRLYTFVSPLGNYKQPFNIIFDAYFQPSKWVQDGIDDAYFNLNLQPGQYDAVHLRIGHPAFRNKKKYDDKSKLFDMYGGGYNFSSLITDDDDDDNNNNNNNDQQMVVKAINSATRAIECTKYLVQTQPQQQNFEKLPLYFFSDSIDLIQTVVVDDNNDDDVMDNKTASNNTTSTFHHEEGNDSTVLAALGRLKNTTKHYPGRIVGRTDVPIAHLERRHPSKTATTTTASDNSNTAIINEAHKNTFVDLLVASKARCLSLGIGRYAYMARKISSTTQLQPNGSSNDCWIRHAMEADSSTTAQWGMKLMYKEVPKCPTNIG